MHRTRRSTRRRDDSQPRSAATPQSSSLAPRSVVAGLFASGFFGIFLAMGVLGLIYVRRLTDDSFLRIFLSLIFSAFVLASLLAICGVWSGGRDRSSSARTESRRAAAKDPAATTFGCPRCGAGLDANADISPSGDVKCLHCNNWFSTRRAETE